MSEALTRREFVAAGGAGLVGTLAFSTGGIALLAPSRSWALSLETLDPQVGQTLLRMTRHIYPHDTLEDAVYALVVKALDTEAGEDAELAKMLREGVAELDAVAAKTGAINWLALSSAAQFGALETRSSGAFFQKVRSTAVVALYDNDMAFAHFGYEGPAFPKGGYLTRGFNDLDWLPDPPPSASPAV